MYTKLYLVNYILVVIHYGPSYDKCVHEQGSASQITRDTAMNDVLISPPPPLPPLISPCVVVWPCGWLVVVVSVFTGGWTRKRRGCWPLRTLDSPYQRMILPRSAFQFSSHQNAHITTHDLGWSQQEKGVCVQRSHRPPTWMCHCKGYTHIRLRRKLQHREQSLVKLLDVAEWPLAAVGWFLGHRHLPVHHTDLRLPAFPKLMVESYVSNQIFHVAHQ